MKKLNNLKLIRTTMNAIDTTVDDILNSGYIPGSSVILYDYINLSSTQKIFYNIGKSAKKVRNVLRKPETKAAVLIANWTASAVFLIMSALFAASASVVFAALALFIIETYAVFGTAEYAIAYSIAEKMTKATV